MEEKKAKIWRLIMERKQADAYYREHSDVYRAFVDMEKTAFAEGALAKINKELIAVGISVVMNCESCMEWHIGQALSNGASNEQVIDAIGIGMEMGGGPATVAARFAKDVLEYYNTHAGSCLAETE